MKTYKNRLDDSLKYYENYERRMMSGEWTPKCPPEMMATFLERMIEKRQNEIFNYSLL